jgi:16S rRNA (uracil1498-N3)-methyltransferase
MSSKKIHRFFVPELPLEDTFILRDQALVHQITSVLHLTIGESLIVFGNTEDEYVMRIIAIEKGAITLLRESQRHVSQPRRTVIAAVSIVKRDLFEVIVQKLTELGVSEIVPIISSRTIKQSVRMERLRTISTEALEQSGGTKEVLIHEPLTLSDALTHFSHPVIVYAPGEALQSKELPETVVMYVGPEGGWSSEDMVLFKEHHASLVSLGSRVLRTETAAIVGAYSLLCM